MQVEIKNMVQSTFQEDLKYELNDNQSCYRIFCLLNW